jgi:hypothetical protein
VRLDDGLHVVEDIGDGDAAEESQPAFHAAKERSPCLADGEFEIQIATASADLAARRPR